MSGSRSAAALRCTAVLALLAHLCSCAHSATADSPAPAPDSSVDAGADSAADVASDATVDTPDGEASTPADAAGERVDPCSSDAALEASPEPCTPGALEKVGCGHCGRSVRKCGTDSTWKAWSDCIEDEAAECAPCESHPVACGFCGTRAMRCEVSQDVCRWVLEACDSPGECAPGDYQADATGCSSGLARVRWCSSSCSWSEAADCQPPPSWAPLPASPLSARSAFASAVLQGRWFLWGGVGSAGALGDGALYDPLAATWTSIAPASWEPVPSEAGTASLSPRANALVVSTGAEVLVWGGDNGALPAVPQTGGARYHTSGIWSGVSAENAPSHRSGSAALWAPSSAVVLIWGGKAPTGLAAKGGARYSLASDSWSPMNPAPFGERQGHSVVWDDTSGRMIVWGGLADASWLPERSGAAYDPATDSWTAIADAPIRRKEHAAFWDGARSRMLVLGGDDGLWGGHRSDGAAWEASTNTWEMLPDLAMTGYPIAHGFEAVFAAGQVWVTGGQGASDGMQTARGARYDPVSNAWSRLPELSDGRTGHRAQWLGGLLTWGGQGAQGAWLSSGERLRNLP